MSNSLINKFDFYIIVTIVCLSWGAFELFGAFMPIRLIGLFGLYLSIKNWGKIYSLSFGFSNLFIFWIGYSFVSVIWTLSISSWFIQFCHTTTLMGAIMAMSIWGVKAKNPLKSVSYGWLFFVFVTMPIAIWELNTGNHLSSGSFNMDSDAYALMKDYAAVTFVNYNSYVVMLCMALPFIFVLSLNGSLFDRLLSFVAQSFIFVVLAYNTSRGGIVCFVVGLVLYMYSAFLRMSLFLKILLITLIFYGIYYMIQYIEDIELFDALLRRSESVGLFEDDSRTNAWLRSLKISIYCFFIGTGCGSMPHVMDYFYKGQLAFCHNYLFETLLEYGLLISLFWFCKIFKIVVRNIKSVCGGINYVGLYTLTSAPFLLIIDDYYSQRTGIWMYVASLLILFNYERMCTKECK